MAKRCDCSYRLLSSSLAAGSVGTFLACQSSPLNSSITAVVIVSTILLHLLRCFRKKVGRLCSILCCVPGSSLDPQDTNHIALRGVLQQHRPEPYFNHGRLHRREFVLYTCAALVLRATQREVGLRSPRALSCNVLELLTYSNS